MKRFRPWILGAVLFAGSAQAQYNQAQLVRPAGAADLNGHLARLAANPRDVPALIGAGEAALALDDPRAAAGFFARADAIESGNGRIKTGLARVMLKLQNPAESLRLFDQAGRLGYPDAALLSDRGLARDMTGDQAGAQRDYQAALKATPDDPELVRRYAASLGIAGQVDAAEKVLEPLLYKSDRAAWRYRAFILAMNNKQAEAKGIADQTMPPQLATAIIPYMQKMPYLNPAQKAAALHFGHFPMTIGASIVAIVPTPPAPGFAPAVAVAPVQVATATPAQADRRSRRADRAVRLARAEPIKPPVATLSVPVAAALVPPAPDPQPQVVQPQPAPLQPASADPFPVQSSPVQQITQPPVSAPIKDVQGPPAPGFESIEAAQASVAPTSTAPAPTTSQPAVAAKLNAITLAQASTPPFGPPPPAQPAAPAAATVQPLAAAAPSPMPAPVQPTPAPPQPDPAATRTLADIIRAIDVPDTEKQTSVAAVDLAEIATIQAARRAERLAVADKAKKAAAARAKAETDARARKDAEEKARLAANPSRNWVQIATGANRGALAFTLKAMRRKYALVAPQDGWVAAWARTNRLVVGPFASFTRAKSVEADLKKAGADVFAWQSDAGEVVERLGDQ